MKRGLQALAVTMALVSPMLGQQFNDFGRERAREMLRRIAEDVKKHYYDPKFHGLDFDDRVRQADEKLRQATSVTESFKVIVWALDGLNDSHTYFIPPARDVHVDYGWRMQMIGNRCLVTRVLPKSDAEIKGLKPGDEIISVNGVTATRDNFRGLEYIIGVLSPQPELRVQVRDAGGQQRQLVLAAKIEPVKIMTTNIMAEGQTMLLKAKKIEEQHRPKCESLGTELGLCKMPWFAFEDQQIHDLLNFARKHQALILDLRGARSGNIRALEGLLGGFFDHDIKIGERVSREGTKPQLAKTQPNPFAGKLAVLVDSQSASAPELLARTIQLEKRGTVFGDRSAGSVREAKFYNYEFKMDRGTYRAAITDTDMVMPDGQSLELKGVMPDEVLLPQQADLANGNDPVLAHAAELLGVKLTPDKAGKLLPYTWPED